MAEIFFILQNSATMERMEPKILYKCEGTCGGVSEAPKNCGALDCNMHNQPLKGHRQCEGCASATEKDGGKHLCAMCKPL